MLNQNELNEVKKLLKSLDVQELLNKSINHRKFYLFDKKISLYYISDMSRIAIEQFISSLIKIPKVLNLDIKIEAEEISYGVIVARNVSNVYNLFKDKIKDEDYIKFLLNQYETFRKDLILKFGKVNSAIKNSYLNSELLKDLETSLIKFRSLYLDSFLPYDLIKCQLNLDNEELQLLCRPRNGVSHYLSIYKGIMKVLENKIDINTFIDIAGYMSGEDLFRCNLESVDKVKEHLNNYDMNSDEINEEFRKIYLRSNELKIKQEKLIERFNGYTELHLLLCISAEYNEINRIFVKKYYKLIRELIEKNNLPLKYVTIDNSGLILA